MYGARPNDIQEIDRKCILTVAYKYLKEKPVT